ncbi:alpha/beta hydrolase [Aureibacillus halotolerans]|uniref:Lysophospholipase n=1 Tax=Aureibacillus halotolerans TaxID=1508390 RepID=A0A4R6U494_9BACI|nr:alpha/beta hydrolase [Aureibacillus halotolerans]TDQ40292.1 lysophospholipase [Aureibacillus halotolerans]
MWVFETEAPVKGVVVIVHGAVEHHGRYMWVKEQWLADGFHVIMGDLPGQGLSKRKRGHILHFEEYIEEVLRWLEEAQRFLLPIFLLGHSMGGLTAVRLLQKHTIPLAGVILSSPALGLKIGPSAPLDALSKGLNLIIPQLQMSPGITPQIATRNRDICESDVNDSLMLTKVSVRWYRELARSIQLSFKELLDFPDLPLLIMQGGNDKIVEKSSVMRWFNALPSTEKMYKEWPGLYHEIFNEPEREQVYRFAQQFASMHLPIEIQSSPS